MTSSTPIVSKAIVTGHTRGLGAALSEVLLARGFAVLGVARTRHASLAARFAGTFEEAEADLDHHARAIALGGERALRIATIAPGVVDTDMQTALRETDKAGFPSRDKLVELKRTGQLTSPQQAAEKFVDYLLSSGFGGADRRFARAAVVGQSPLDAAPSAHVFRGQPNRDWGGCLIFGDRQVTAKGWCAPYTNT